MNARTLSCAVAAACASAWSGCGDWDLGGSPGAVRNWSFQSTGGPMLDLLYVIDPTPAIAPVAGNVAAGLPRMASVLSNVAGPSGAPALPNDRVAFVPATVPGAGCDPPPLRNQLCGVAAPDQFVSAQACGTVTNYPGALADTFSCLGDFGSTGCGALQPLEAMRRALDGSAFLRPDATLWVVIVAGADDASSTGATIAPVDDYVAFLKGLKRDPDLVGVSVIGPPTDCSSSATLDETAPRLGAFANAFGSNASSLPACDQDYAPVLDPLAATPDILRAPPCLDGIRDIDPTAPGLQADCRVEADVTQLDGTVQHTVVGPCDRAAPTCWTLTADDAICGPGPGGAKLSILWATPPCDQLPIRVTVSCPSF